MQARVVALLRRIGAPQQREASGGVRMMLVFNAADKAAGPDCEFAVTLS